MSDCMTFPETVDEFMESYKMVDTEHIYSNGTEYVPIFRMKQWFEHQPECKTGHWILDENGSPTFLVDYVKVVRCKDCKYSVCIPNHIGEDWFCDIKYNEWGEPWVTSPEGFCNGGERKETE